MAIQFDRAQPSAYDALISKVRRWTGDRDTADPKWSNDELGDFINDELRFMYLKKVNQKPGDFEIGVTFTYTAGSEAIDLTGLITVPVNYGPTLAVRPFLRVEDYSSPLQPLILPRISVLSADRYASASGTPIRPGRCWWRHDIRLGIVPRPTADLAVRVRVIENPFILDRATPATDQYPWPSEFEEMVVLGAAKRALMPDEELPMEALKLYYELQEEFDVWSAKYKGEKHPRRERNRG